MPVRKLNRSGGGDDGGSQQPIHVDDAAVDIFVESLLDSKARGNGGQSEGSDGQQEKAPKGKLSGWAPPTRRLQQSTADVIAALHEAKQELAKEMEANLKQLKAVLQETQRIAKDMEAVLGEAKGQPAQPQQDDDRNAQGSSARGDKQDAWNPPVLKNKAGKQQQDEQDDTSGDDDEAQQSPPQWEPPVELH